MDTLVRLVHSGLPRLIKQLYGTELRSRTLASMKPEISQALDSLLDELHTAEDAKSLRTVTSRLHPTSFPSSKPRQVLSGTRSNNLTKFCPLCKQVRRTDYSHFLSECPFLPERDRHYIARARQVADITEESNDEPGGITCAHGDKVVSNTDFTDPQLLMTGHVAWRFAPTVSIFYL